MKVKLIGWRPGVKTVSLIQAIHEYSGVGLISSKKLVEELLNNNIIEIDLKKEDVAIFKKITQEFGVLYHQDGR